MHGNKWKKKLLKSLLSFCFEIELYLIKLNLQPIYFHLVYHEACYQQKKYKEKIILEQYVDTKQ